MKGWQKCQPFSVLLAKLYLFCMVVETEIQEKEINLKTNLNNQ